MNTVIIAKNKYIFKDKIYEDNEIDSILNKCSKKIRVIITEENLLIKICEKVELNSEEAIEKNILSNLIIDEDTLVDYKVDKKLKRMYVYSVKQGIKVSKILLKAEKMLVEPIQYILINILKKKFRCKNSYKALVKINNHIYFICVENNNLIYSKTIEEKEEGLNKLIQEDLIEGKLLVDINLKQVIENILESKFVNNINFINLKEKVEHEISKV